jgi:hypothetical protein
LDEGQAKPKPSVRAWLGSAYGWAAAFECIPTFVCLTLCI